MNPDARPRLGRTAAFAAATFLSPLAASAIALAAAMLFAMYAPGLSRPPRVAELIGIAVMPYLAAFFPCLFGGAAMTIATIRSPRLRPVLVWAGTGAAAAAGLVGLVALGLFSSLARVDMMVIPVAAFAAASGAACASAFRLILGLAYPWAPPRRGSSSPVQLT